MSAQSHGPSAQAVLDVALRSLIQAKRIVLLAGAGISTDSGIPDFRGRDGLYNRAKKARDLFSADVFRDPEQLQDFYRFCASLEERAASARPSETHAFAAKLAAKGKLLRMYTQNVDGLELAGLKEASTPKEGHVVQLHGSIHRLRCSCGYRGPASADSRNSFAKGEAPECPACAQRAIERKRDGKRALNLMSRCGQLRPDMVLYDEAYPTNLSLQIAEITAADMGKRVDFVLVMGTSLRIPGFKRLVKDFARIAKAQGGTRPRVVLVNEEDVLSKEWNGIFDVHVRGRCDTFCAQALRLWKSRRPEDFLVQSALGDMTNFTVVKMPVETLGKSQKRPAEEQAPITAAKKARNPQRLPTPPTSSPRILQHRRTSSITRI